MAESCDTPRDKLEKRLLALNIKKKGREFIRTKGRQFIDDPELLADKLRISIEQAKEALEALSSEKKCLTKGDINSIEKFLKKHPKIQNAGKIAAFCDLDEDLVDKYLESKPLSKSQKDSISGLFKLGNSINDIAYDLKLYSHKNIQEYVDSKFITFCGEEGQGVLQILQKIIDTPITVAKLREMIKTRNLKLQDQLGCILLRDSEGEYERVRRYFQRFDESRHFFEIDRSLTIHDILFIRDNNLSIEQLSIQLNKVEAVIRDHLRRYCPNQEETDYDASCQKRQIENIVVNFGKSTKTFHTYRTIITECFDNMIKRKEQGGVTPMEAFDQLLPLIFYYLKCSLSFEDITRVIAKSCKVTLTNYDIFHMTFQLSDPVVRGLCIEHYSFSNPVPLYYPKMKTELLRGDKVELSFCTELWYCIQEYHGLVSFGIGQASWNPIGKSSLLDVIFETDFVEGNPQNCAFHLQSIDIQMSKNLFGKLNSKAPEEATKWSYIDCHRYSDPKVIKVICQRVNIALIHVSYFDYKENLAQIMKEIHQLETCISSVYLFIRDYDGYEVMIQKKDERIQYIFLPNLTKRDMTVYSTLKQIGYEILHLKNVKLIGTEFIEYVASELKSPNLEEIHTDKRIIQTIINYITEHPMSIREINFSFLSYYPSFVKYMSIYYQASFEANCKTINELNMRCVNLKEFLEKSILGDIALHFNEILERNYSGLVLLKLSQELSALTDRVLLQNKEATGRYSIEIVWREALLSSKYGNYSKCKKNRTEYTMRFSRNFSNYVERGDAFELIDGDNLRFFNKDINGLLTVLYKKQFDELSVVNEGKKALIKQAPIVVSIFGPQSSGKSTLLNYCFGCKFLTSAGRCTKGIYGSLAKLSKPINLSNQFLILDTEGLDSGGKRGVSDITFDRTMVLFCLAVSQVVIINIKGELGEEMQNMLQICAYSLLKLKVSKVVCPKIFFVLNQQADPDPDKHLDAINNLLDKLNEESDLMELEGSKISDLIQFSRKNLFILPCAFNIVQMNKPAAKLFDSDVVKLTPTTGFAESCAVLRQAIVDQLIEMPIHERASFSSMRDWLEMSGVIWETIIRYQDIVKYRNVDEMKSYNFLRTVVGNLMMKHICRSEKDFDNITEQLVCEIKEITKLESQTLILEEKMLTFDDTYRKHHEECLIEFNTVCQNDSLLKRMTHVCEEVKSNLARLIYIERKNYKDRLKDHIRAVLTELKLAQNMGRFQEIISQNIDKYLDKSEEEQREAFEEIWKESFGDDGREEENERDEDFDNLYTIFKMESKTMENKGTIHDLILKSEFDLDEAIQRLRSKILQTFEYNPTYTSTVDFIYPCMQNNVPIRDMTPHPGKEKYEYFGKDTLYTVHNTDSIYTSAEISRIKEWVPEHCHSLVYYCSGYFNHADITWELEERKQIMLLASLLKDPQNAKESTWKKLLNNISSKVQEITDSDTDISQGTVKQLVNFLCSTIHHVNHEINFIQASLTIEAERTLSTLMFVYAFKSKWGVKAHKRTKSRMSNQEEKRKKMGYFLNTVESSKLARGNWDRKAMRLNDCKASNHFALEFLEAVKREVITDELTNIRLKFKDMKQTISYKSIFLRVEELIKKELESRPGKEIIDQNNIVIQSICNRNEIIKREFKRKWDELIEGIYAEILKNMKSQYGKELQQIKVVLLTMLQSLDNKSRRNPLGDTKFDSDSIFMLDITSEEHASEERASKEHASEERASKELTSEEHASEERASKEHASEERASKELTSKEHASEERASKENASEERASKELTSEERASKELTSEEHASEERASKELTSEEHASEERASKEHASEERASKELTSEERASKELTSEEHASKEMASEEPVTIELTSEEHASKEMASEERVSKELTSEEPVTKERANASLLKSAVIYLQKYLDPEISNENVEKFLTFPFKVEGLNMKNHEDSCLCLKPMHIALNKKTFIKLKNTSMFNCAQIFNIHQYVKEFIHTLDGYEFELSRSKLEDIIKPLKDEYASLVINCPSQCPSCGKFCEQEIHPHSGRCQIKTGHQICSMGGKVWMNDTERTAVLHMCDDYTDYSRIQIPGQQMTWGKFKERTIKEWDWSVPNDSEYRALQNQNREKMVKIWDLFGREILNYHAAHGVDIKYIPYSEFGKTLAASKASKYRICFVIDGTGSMSTDIDRARVSVKQLISIYEKRGNPAVFKVVIYRDHCDGDRIIEKFPEGSGFIAENDKIEHFLNQIRVGGGGDEPEAVLDGLSIATTKCDWNSTEGWTNVIVHIYDAPPHGQFPNYRSHSSSSNGGNCCCCNHGTLCHFDWEKDVWQGMHRFGIQYNGITTGRKFAEFEAAMKENLGDLCGDFQQVGKETVNDAILSIFIDYKTD